MAMPHEVYGSIVHRTAQSSWNCSDGVYMNILDNSKVMHSLMTSSPMIGWKSSWDNALASTKRSAGLIMRDICKKATP